MKRMVIDKPVKIILDGLEFLFESGDSILVRDRKEVIKEAVENLTNDKLKLDKLHEMLDDIESDIAKLKNKLGKTKKSPDGSLIPALTPEETEKVEDKLEELTEQRKKFNNVISKLEISIAKKTGELEKYGPEMVEKFIQRNKEEKEREEKEKERQETEIANSDIEDKIEELENAKAEYERYKEKEGIIVGENGEYQSPSKDSETGYDALTLDQEKAISNYTQLISDLQEELDFDSDEINYMDDEYVEDQSMPDMTHSIMTRDELKSGVLRTSGDDYDDDATIAQTADKISDFLINGGFQPEELGSFSDMISTNAEDALNIAS